MLDSFVQIIWKKLYFTRKILPLVTKAEDDQSGIFFSSVAKHRSTSEFDYAKTQSFSIAPNHLNLTLRRSLPNILFSKYDQNWQIQKHIFISLLKQASPGPKYRSKRIEKVAYFWDCC